MKILLIITMDSNVTDQLLLKPVFFCFLCKCLPVHLRLVLASRSKHIMHWQMCNFGLLTSLLVHLNHMLVCIPAEIALGKANTFHTGTIKKQKRQSTYGQYCHLKVLTCIYLPHKFQIYNVLEKWCLTPIAF